MSKQALKIGHCTIKSLNLAGMLLLSDYLENKYEVCMPSNM